MAGNKKLRSAQSSGRLFYEEEEEKVGQEKEEEEEDHKMYVYALIHAYLSHRPNQNEN